MSSPRPTPEPERSERHALLVANSRYLDAKLHRLRAPAEDAGHLKDLLLDPAVGFFDTVTKIVDGTKGEIEEQLEALFLDREPGDLVLLYVSTHGIKNDQGELFFAASNTKLALPRSTAVSGALVQGVLEDCRASTKLVLLDCCYSGAFTRGMVPKAADVPVAQLAGRGTCVITATDELQYAFEGEHQYLDRDVHRSVFTSAVIKGLETGDADLDRDGVVTGDELYRYVFAEVRRQGKQTPTRHNQLQGDFTVARTRLAMGPLRPAGKPVVVTLDRVLPAHADGEAPVERVPLSAPVGQLAEPLGHSGIVQLDLTGHGGHVAVVGQLHSGKSTFLQTLVVSLSLTHSADEALFFCVDPGGQLVGLDRLPHVRAVIDSAERGPRLSRMLAHLTRTLDERRMLFRQRRITSAEKFRAARRDPDFPAGQHADLFLVVDGWEQATRDHPELARAVHTLASAGLHFCLHVLVTARSWRELPPDLERLLLGRVELRLSDPAESRIDPDLAATLPQRSGVGLHDGGRFVIAAPEVDGASGYDLDELMEPAEATAEPDWILQDAPPAPVDEPPRVPSLPELLGLPASPTPETVRDAWRRRPAARRLCVPFGVDERGEPVRLDIKEAAMEGMGPHGLCIGATGSGKSELLRTLVLGMLATHSPDELNVVLVDYKGGATFLGLDEAPHVSAVITNLADDAALVDRMRDALFGEMNRRQEALKNGGNFKNVWEYEKARENGADLEPLPALFIVVDEFSELLSAKPDFIDLFVAIGRLGRSLQMHLLLASQRLEEGKLRGLDSHLSYRIGLRTFSAMESRVAIGMPDAYELPREPGVGYLTYDTSTLVRFKAAYVSGPRPPDGTSDLASLVAALPRVAGARRIWLPPLDAAPTLADLLPPLALTDRGFGPAVGAEVGTLRVPVGIVDRPYEQRRDPLWADFSGASGHGVVVGGP
ncbi:caspase, EACC1-associated type, partial [Amycolatopsis arida]|uniref:caspase, EACC1-associated type n=1 Tax=Amycolatopsis arida TaxID=587909 RepID=UPI0010EFB237